MTYDEKELTWEKFSTMRQRDGDSREWPYEIDNKSFIQT